MHHVVAWDPSGEYWDGALVDATRARQLESEGAVLLPVVPRLFRMSGVGGFAKRSWGAGLSLPTAAPALVAPLTLYAAQDLRGLHWAARLVPDGDPLPIYNGHVRLATDGAQPSTIHAALTAAGGQQVDLRQLPPADDHGGWTVRGSGVVSPGGDGYCGFALYGFGLGLRVAWVAASQAEV